MKKLFFIVTLILQFNSGYSQNLRINSERQIIIDTIVSVDTIPATEIYNAVKKWSIKNFINLKEVTVYDSPEEIQFRYIQNIDNGSALIPIYTTLSVKIKTGKIKFEFSRMSWAEYGTTYESVLITKDGILRDNKPSKNMIKSTEERFKTCVQNISKILTEKDDKW